jgi:nitroreductase
MEIFSSGWHVAAGTIMNPIKGGQLLAQLNWRYATKQFDPARKIPPEDWAVLENALILSQSSYGLQPWKFIVITDQKMRETFSSDVEETTDSRLLAFYRLRRERDRHVARTVEVHGGAVEALKRYRDIMVGDVVTGARTNCPTVGSAPGLSSAREFITSAALLGIDTCPMEGFQPDEYGRILDLAPKRLASVVRCAAGYRRR